MKMCDLLLRIDFPPGDDCFLKLLNHSLSLFPADASVGDRLAVCELVASSQLERLIALL